MATLAWIEYKSRDGVVRLHGDDGSVTEVAEAAFKADEATHLAAFTTAVPELSKDEKLAAAEARVAALEKALLDGGKLTQAELDAAAVEVKG